MSATYIAEPAVASSGTGVEEADIAVAEKLGRQRGRPVVRAVGGLSEIADQAPSFALCGAVLAAGLICRKPGMAEAGARMLASVLVAAAIKSAVKGVVSRTRPHVLLDEGRYEFQALGPGGGDRHSFPSGHTAGAVAAARGLARACPGLSGPAYGAAAVIAVVQVFRAKHYPMDVAAGALIGIASELLVDRTARLLNEPMEGSRA